MSVLYSQTSSSPSDSSSTNRVRSNREVLAYASKGSAATPSNSSGVCGTWAKNTWKIGLRLDLGDEPLERDIFVRNRVQDATPYSGRELPERRPVGQVTPQCDSL